MNDSDIPILNKAYELYKTFHLYRLKVPKHDRHTIYEKAERTILDFIEYTYHASYTQGTGKTVLLQKASAKLNMLRLLVRLMKDIKTLQTKQYIILEQLIDNTGQQLGGWIRSSR
ncbi:MAG: four helix bundle protein [Candidatus Andersenbacteria bacterium]|nr:four helix bundle protein [Candidatus Andersenbacteria bacterium]